MMTGRKGQAIITGCTPLIAATVQTLAAPVGADEITDRIDHARTEYRA